MTPQDEWHAKAEAWARACLIAADVTIETPHWRGRFIVEDVEDNGHTTTYKMFSADGPAPLALGMLGPAGGGLV